MLRKALAGGVQSGESSVEEAVNPTAEQVVQRIEHYQLVTGEDGKPVELGRGAMGVTYKAFDVDLHCPVTLKVISERYLGDETARRRFLREARAAARLRHSNIASVLRLGRTGSSYFYAMEFLEGETLQNLIKRSGRLEAKLALEVVVQVAAGLAALHRQKLVHRDIKPSNVMVSLENGGWFGDADPRLGTTWEKGERLAKLVSHRRTLFWMAWSRSKIRLAHKKGGYGTWPPVALERTRCFQYRTLRDHHPDADR
jgi:serine/threonine protein kinase